MATGEAHAAAQHEQAARAEVEAMASAVVDDDLRSAVETAWLSPLDEIVAG